MLVSFLKNKKINVRDINFNVTFAICETMIEGRYSTCYLKPFE